MLMARLATFTFKCVSLFQFERETRVNGTLLHNVGEVATDEATRQCSDQVSPEQIGRVLKKLMAEAQRVGVPAKRFKVFDGFYVLAINGTGVYSPNKSG